MRETDEPAGTSLPGWLEFERTRPLKRVQRRFEVLDRGSWNPYAKYWVEQLECGHTLQVFGPELNGKFAKRRRCRECAEEALAMTRMRGERDQDYQERRIMADERRKATAEYLAGPRPQVDVPLMCGCDARPYPHELSVHDKVFRKVGMAWVRGLNGRAV